MRMAALVVVVCVCVLFTAGCVPAATPAPPQPTPLPPPTPVPPTPATDLVAPVKAWVDAINKGDVEAALAPFTDNVWWTASYRDTEAGKEHLRGLFESLAGIETKHQIGDCQPEGADVVCAFSIVDGCIAAYGAPDGLSAKLTFKFQPDGKIGETSMTADDPRWKDYLNFYGAETAWAVKNHAEEVAKAEEGGREGGATVAKLCQEYAESLK
jgi:ketosteroid isomerase-like protein